MLTNHRSRLLTCCVCLHIAFLTPPAGAITFEELVRSFDVLETVAGTAQVTGRAVNGWQASMEGGPAVAAELSRPHMTMADWRGNLVIADKDAHSIRTVSATDGTIQTWVGGTDVGGFNGDGPASEVVLNAPNGLYTFPNGTTYVLDLNNSLIRRVSIEGEVTTIVDDPAGLGAGRGLWVSPDEQTIYYSAGTDVRRWTAAEGISTYASGFIQLGNLTVDPSDGNVVATDREGHAVYKLLPNGTRQRIAGNGQESGGSSGMPATQVGLKEVRGVHFHPEGGYLLATHDGGQIWFVDDNDTVHLLIDGDDDGTHAGDGQLLSVPGRKISEPRAVVMAPDGDLIVTEHDGGYIRVAESLQPYLMGDFDQNRELDANDIDLLTESFRDGTHWQTLDVTFDGLVDQQDRDHWVNELRNTSYGDSNLDGVFDSSDFVEVFTRGKYEDATPLNAGWADGDWNGDGDFTSGDLVTAFVSGGYQQPTAASQVPEPMPFTPIIVAVFSLFWSTRRRRWASVGG